jgi:hypothetical protein
VGFQLQDEVRDDLDKGEEQMLLLLVATGLDTLQQFNSEVKTI